jgi:hypothetical protein
MPITNYARDQLLDAIFNADTAGFPAGDPFFQLHSGDPNATAASNVVNVARVQAAFPAAASGTLANSANIDFASMPAVSGDGVYAWSAWDGAGAGGPPTGGNALWWGFFMGASPLEGVADVDSADLTSNLFQSAAHGLSANDRIAFLPVNGNSGGQVTTPSAFHTGTGVLYYVIATGLTANEFSVSTTSGGAALDIATNDGAIRWIRVVGKTTNSGDTFRISSGTLSAFLEA